MNLLPTNCAIDNVLHGEFLAEVTLNPKSTGSVSSALFKYLTTFSLFLSLREALVSDWHCLVNRVEAAMRRVLMFLLLRYSSAASPGLNTPQGLQQQCWGWMMEPHSWPGTVTACSVQGAKEPQNG